MTIPSAGHPRFLSMNYLLTILYCAASLAMLPLDQVSAFSVTMEYYHHNHQGSLLEVYDGKTNKRLLSQAWSPWGERQVLYAAVSGDKTKEGNLLAHGLPVHLGYTAHKTLLATGLIFAGDTRLYDPRLKRFLNSDDRTTGGIRGQNRYSYAYNNPMNFIDPDGRAPRRWGRFSLIYTSGYSYVQHRRLQIAKAAAAVTIQAYGRRFLARKRYLKASCLSSIVQMCHSQNRREYHICSIPRDHRLLDSMVNECIRDILSYKRVASVMLNGLFNVAAEQLHEANQKQLKLRHYTDSNLNTFDDAKDVMLKDVGVMGLYYYTYSNDPDPSRYDRLLDNWRVAQNKFAVTDAIMRGLEMLYPNDFERWWQWQQHAINE